MLSEAQRRVNSWAMYLAWYGVSFMGSLWQVFGQFVDGEYAVAGLGGHKKSLAQGRLSPAKVKPLLSGSGCCCQLAGELQPDPHYRVKDCGQPCPEESNGVAASFWEGTVIVSPYQARKNINGNIGENP